MEKNHNTEINIEVDELKGLLVKAKENSTSQIISTCPYCNKDDHFYINKKTLLWDCKKCKESGNGFTLLSFLGVLSKFITKSIKLNSLVKLSNDVEEVDEIENVDLPDKKLPFGFKRLYSHPYLIDRGLTVTDFYKHKIGVCINRKLKDYVIISIEEDGKCKGYVSRCILPKEVIESKSILRYRNSKGVKFNSLLFGFEEITKNTKTVIIVEGVFDKIRLDNLLKTSDSDEIKVVCTFGNKISSQQLNKLRITNIENIVLFYDLDAINEMKSNSPKIKKYFDLKIACLMSGKDPGDAHSDEVFDALSNTYEPSLFFREKCNGRKIKV